MKKTKRFISLFLSLLTILNVFANLQIEVFAKTYSGACGLDLVWSFDPNTEVLTISGNGKMYDFEYNEENLDDIAPWGSFRSKIKKVVIEEGVTEIANYAFYSYPALTKVFMCDTVNVIHSCAFEDCHKLKSVVLSQGVVDIYDYAFDGCKKLSNISLPESLNYIGMDAFSKSGLVKVNIPKNVEFIGEYAFSICNKLESIYVDKDNKYYCTKNGVLFNKKKTVLLQYPIANKRTRYVIPNGVKKVAMHACSYNKNLKTLYIPKSVDNIKFCAFYGCKNLNKICYSGSKSKWKKIKLGSCNGISKKAIRYNTSFKK